VLPGLRRGGRRHRRRGANTGCEDGLHAYDGATGTPAWSLSTPFASGLDYSISIGRGRMLYVNASNGTLYAVGP
jgi:hypothetical protein